MTLFDPIVAARFRKYLPTIFAPYMPPYGAGETSFPLPILDSHHGRDRYPPRERKAPLRRERKLVQISVRPRSTFTDCLSSPIEQRVYHRTDAILTSIS